MSDSWNLEKSTETDHLLDVISANHFSRFRIYALDLYNIRLLVLTLQNHLETVTFCLVNGEFSIFLSDSYPIKVHGSNCLKTTALLLRDHLAGSSSRWPRSARPRWLESGF
jgi:hypothetical protein